MRVDVSFYAYFKELTGCAGTTESIPDGSTLDTLLDHLQARFPRLAEMRPSMLTAVGVEYQPRTHPLRDGDRVSLFPPVQGG